MATFKALNFSNLHSFSQIEITAAVAQWIKAFAPQVGGWMFESRPRRPKSAKRSVSRVSRVLGDTVTIINGCPVYSKCGTLKNSNCSMAMSAEHRSKIAALHRQWGRLQMSEFEKFSSGTKNSKQTNNQIGSKSKNAIKI